MGSSSSYESPQRRGSGYMDRKKRQKEAENENILAQRKKLAFSLDEHSSGQRKKFHITQECSLFLMMDSSGFNSSRPDH